MRSEFHLSTSISNIRVLNGWAPNNERIYNRLTWKEKEAVNILMIEQMRYFLKSERLGFKKLVRYVKENQNVVKLSDDIIDRMQLKALNEEINQYRRNNEEI